MPGSFFDYFESDRPSIDPNDWPAWGRGRFLFKQYPEASRVFLPPPGLLNSVSLQEALLQRRTTRAYKPEPIKIDHLSTLLFWTTGLIHFHQHSHLPYTIESAPLKISAGDSARRSYPSPGALFPSEIYIATLIPSDKLPRAIYHYNALQHSLEVASPEIGNLLDHPPYEFIRTAAHILLISFRGRVLKEKYGSLAYKFSLLEPGHILQNAYLISTVLGLGISALGTGNQAADQILQFDPGEEVVVYQAALGIPETGYIAE